MALTEQQDRVITVLQRMIDLVSNDEDYAEMMIDPIDDLLEEIAMNDGFGTERQMDPRGDGRDSDEWSMYHIQGYDE